MTNPATDTYRERTHGPHKQLKYGVRYRDSAEALREQYEFESAPPAPCGVGTFDPRNREAELHALAAAGWQLRARATTTAGLVPVTVTGDCLTPLWPSLAAAARTGWFDPTLPAADGDYVIARPSEACIQRVFAFFHYTPQRDAAKAAQLRAARECAR